MATEPSDAKPARMYHVTFMQPVRVVLQDKSSPLIAVHAFVSVSDTDSDVLILKCRIIFPVSSSGVTARVKLEVPRHNIAGCFEVVAQ